MLQLKLFKFTIGVLFIFCLCCVKLGADLVVVDHVFNEVFRSQDFIGLLALFGLNPFDLK